VVAQAKVDIRRLLPVGLREPVRRVRVSVAYAVSAIAHWDWPEAWPELFGILMEALASGSPDAIHGAMRVLTGKATRTVFMIHNEQCDSALLVLQ